MPHTRRAFLRDGLRSVLSVGFLLAASRAGLGQDPSNTTPTVPIEVQKDPVFMFSEETFKPYVGGVFTAPNARGEKIELKLVELQSFTASTKLTRRSVPSKSFSLLFKASAELPPFTSIHSISHPSLGEFDLFLTKRKTDDGDLFYEAVINHFN
jgi:hypothetical protein